MNTLEKTFWKLLSGHLPVGAHAQRIETGGTGLGIPDVNICFEGVELWWELKIVEGKRVALTPEQVVWHHRRARAGGVSYILARDKVDGARKGKYDRIHLWPGRMAPLVKEQGVAAPSLMFAAPFDWPTLVAKALSKGCPRGR